MMYHRCITVVEMTIDGKFSKNYITLFAILFSIFLKEVDIFC